MKDYTNEHDQKEDFTGTFLIDNRSQRSPDKLGRSNLNVCKWHWINNEH
jgi:hypothetical protein